MNKSFAFDINNKKYKLYNAYGFKFADTKKIGQKI